MVCFTGYINIIISASKCNLSSSAECTGLPFDDNEGNETTGTGCGSAAQPNRSLIGIGKPIYGQFFFFLFNNLLLHLLLLHPRWGRCVHSIHLFLYFICWMVVFFFFFFFCWGTIIKIMIIKAVHMHKINICSTLFLTGIPSHLLVALHFWYKERIFIIIYTLIRYFIYQRQWIDQVPQDPRKTLNWTEQWMQPNYAARFCSLVESEELWAERSISAVCLYSLLPAAPSSWSVVGRELAQECVVLKLVRFLGAPLQQYNKCNPRQEFHSPTHSTHSAGHCSTRMPRGTAESHTNQREGGSEGAPYNPSREWMHLP